MRSSICQLIVVSLIFVSLEGAADVVTEGVPHGTDEVHQSEFGHPLKAHDGESSDTELDDEHCQHCCHGHSAAVAARFESIKTPLTSNRYRSGRSANHRDFARAPPTPPPNA